MKPEVGDILRVHVDGWEVDFEVLGFVEGGLKVKLNWGYTFMPLDFFERLGAELIKKTPE
jgi:hypothetical protein